MTDEKEKIIVGGACFLVLIAYMVATKPKPPSAASAPSVTWRSPDTGLSVGSPLYLRSDMAHIGKVLLIETHTFPDGSEQEGVEIASAENGTPFWVPRGFANTYYFTK